MHFHRKIQYNLLCLMRKWWVGDLAPKQGVSSHRSDKRGILDIYRISGIFHVGLIFAEFATSLKLPKIDTAKNKPYFACSSIVLEIAKIGLSENLTHIPSVIFAKISRREKFQIYGMHSHFTDSGLRIRSGVFKTDLSPRISTNKTDDI